MAERRARREIHKEKKEDRAAPKVRHSLRMELIQRPVHAHRHFEVVQPTVLSDLVHHGGHACTTELCRTPGDHGAHLLHDDAVVAGALQP